MQNHYFGGSNPPVASNYHLGMLVFALAACSAAPPPAPPPSFVEWHQPDDPVARPLAVFVGPPGSTLDLLARDVDVTTFLNDRFHPLLLPAFGSQPSGTAAIYSADGCVLIEPFVPASPEIWIQAANRAVVLPGAKGRSATSAAARGCPD